MATETEEVALPVVIRMEVRLVNGVPQENLMLAASRYLMEPRELTEKPRTPKPVEDLIKLQLSLQSNRARDLFNARWTKSVETAIIEELEAAAQRSKRNTTALGPELDYLSGRINAYHREPPKTNKAERDRERDRHLKRLVVAGYLALRLKKWEVAADFLEMANVAAMFHDGFQHSLEGKLKPLLDEARANRPDVPHKTPYWAR